MGSESIGVLVDLQLFAHDSAGTHRLPKLCSRTRAGHVVQVLAPGEPSGLHRTLHVDGRVHDRSTNPPSTTSSGFVRPLDQLQRELWVDRLLTDGQLTEFSVIQKPVGGQGFVVDLTSGWQVQRLQVWLTKPTDVEALIAQLRSTSTGPMLNQFSDIDGDLARVVVSLGISKAAT